MHTAYKIYKINEGHDVSYSHDTCWDVVVIAPGKRKAFILSSLFCLFLVSLLRCFALLSLADYLENMFLDLFVVRRAVSHVSAGTRAVPHVMVGPRARGTCNGRAASGVTCNGRSARVYGSGHAQCHM